jgi:transposase-like protein
MAHVATQSGTRAKAAQLLAAGMPVAKAARTLGIGRATLNRWRKEHPSEFENAEPAEPEDVHRALLRAIMDNREASDADRMRASRELRELDASHMRAAGSGRITVTLSRPSYCPRCHAYLGEPEAHVSNEDNSERGFAALAEAPAEPEDNDA